MTAGWESARNVEKTPKQQTLPYTERLCQVSSLSTNKESTQMSPDPFPHERVGSGHETIKGPWSLGTRLGDE